MARPKCKYRRVLVSPTYFDELLKQGALTCSKCGVNLVAHGKPCSRSSPLLGRPSEQPKSRLAEVLLRYGYKQILHEEVSGVSSDLYVRAYQGVHRAQISHNGNQVSVLMPGHYEVYTDPVALEGALWAMFGPLAN